MPFEAPHHVAAVVFEAERSTWSDQRGFQQFEQRGEVFVVAIVWRRREQEQRASVLGGNPARQAIAVRDLVVVPSGGEVVGFIDDDHIPTARGQVAEGALAPL